MVPRPRCRLRCASKSCDLGGIEEPLAAFVQKTRTHNWSTFPEDIFPVGELELPMNVNFRRSLDVPPGVTRVAGAAVPVTGLNPRNPVPVAP